MIRKGIAIFILLTMIFSIHTSVFADNDFSFSDMKSHWSIEYVADLFNRGIISGYPDGTFKPNNNVTRAEAIKLLVVSVTGNDVGSNKGGFWADNYIRQAISMGYVLESEFDDYNKPMTRVELAKIIVRAIDEEYPSNMNEYSKQITDYNTINDKDNEYVLKAYVKGIITGYTDGTFKPNNSVTRAEASTMLVRLLEPSKRIIPTLEETKKEEPKPKDETFIEPKIYVHYFTQKYVAHHFSFLIENYEDYEGGVEHTFVTECISHPEINLVYARDLYGNFMDKKIDKIEQQKRVSPKFSGGDSFYNLSAKYTWKPVNGTFNIQEGDLMKYKVTVSNGTTTKEYIVEATFNDREFYGENNFK